MIQVYTGDGKGKTTAALGLAMRSVGALKTVAIVQFMKDGSSSEFKTIKKYKLPIEFFAFGIGFYISPKIRRTVKQSHKIVDKHTEYEHSQAAKKALLKAKDLIESKKYDLIILDEINVALAFKLIETREVINILKMSKCLLNRDIILTGQKAPKEILKIADLVTVMSKEKHYFERGIKARKGIEY